MKRGGRIDDAITMEYGAGGVAMRVLIEELLAQGFPEPRDGIGLAAMDDGAAIRIGERWLVVTTDSHVIQPFVFPGGDIGRLAISGTVNDLAMMGAYEPLGLTAAVILEEGFARTDLERVCVSMRSTCREAGTTVITGDTKVMGHGELDGIVINTTGVGLCRQLVRDDGLRPGDRLVVTGTVGDHGLAIMATRNALELDTDLCSDVAPIGALVGLALGAGGDGVVAMKDPTRGGLSSALNEMADKSGVGIVVDERAVPLRAQVRSAGELLGIDPFHVANEGKAVIGVRADRADAVVDALHEHPLGREAAVIGECLADYRGKVLLDTGIGRRLLTEPRGEPMPRIC